MQHYVEQQKSLGRFPRPINNKLMNVTQWLAYKNIVSQDVQVMFGLSLLFLLVCLFNAASLLSAKLHSKTVEIGLRRALGANYQAVFSQFLLETSCIGLAGGLLGLLLASIGLQGIRQLYTNYSQLVHLDSVLVLSIILLAVISTLIAGLIPIWRACRVMPAMQLKEG